MAAFFSLRRGLAVCNCGLGTDFAELLAEFFHATGGVDDLVLAGEEWVRFGGNLDLHQWVLFTFVGRGVAGLDGRAGDELEVAGHVVEQDFAVIWMGISFHAFLSILVAKQHFVGPYCLSTRLLITCQGLNELAIIT